MSKSKKSSNKPTKLEKIVLVTAIAQLVTALIELLSKLLE